MKTKRHRYPFFFAIVNLLPRAKPHAKQRDTGVPGILKNLFLIVACLQLMSACSVLQQKETITEIASVQNQRAANALWALWDMQDIDTLVSLDNRWLATQFETALKTRGEVAGPYRFYNIKHIFDNQIIILESLVDISDEAGNTITAHLSGEVILKYRGKGLEWRSRFNEIQVINKNFIFTDKTYAEAGPELNDTLLQKLRADMAQAATEKDSNTITLNPVPLGEVQVGAALPGFTESLALNTQSLRGVFMIAGSSELIESSSTSVALDLTFIPDLSTCPADVTVARAEFVADVKSREPLGIARDLNNAPDIRYFYSEIRGAKRPMTIIHYWFVDGLPLAAEELHVGASERWRTWSRKGAAKTDASQWEVLMVDKESGCILTSKSIRKLESDTLITRVNQAQANETFVEFKNEFRRRTAGFSIVDDKPHIALIEITRPFLTGVLQASLADLSMDAGFEQAGTSRLEYSAQLKPFDTGDIVCEHRDCPASPVCKTSLTQCKRLRDTLNCASCQFRNPLNNRCVSEAIDPLCEAARNRQNARYEEDYSACVSRAENEKRECDRLNAQVLRSCQIESGFEESACQSVKSGLQALKQGETLAVVKARAQAEGKLIAKFSNFLIEGDLERLKLDMSLHSNLRLKGRIEFKPADSSQSLANCISTWNGPFTSRFASTPELNNLVGDFERTASMLTAEWSGFGVTIDTQPSPLEAVFVDNPHLLANCKIGLTVNKVEAAISGDDAAFFRGETNLVIQPLPTKIHLAPATIEFENTVHSADARLNVRHLLYDIRE
jgi:hypothetical protein